MSHNVRLNGVKFSDITILQAAIREMIDEGARIEFYEGADARFRSWQGRLDACDAVIKCHNGPYDVGFKRDAEGNLEPILEYLFRDQTLSADPNAKPLQGEGCAVTNDGMVLGKLTQRYGIIQAELNAARNGFPAKRVKDGVTGQLHLEVDA